MDIDDVLFGNSNFNILDIFLLISAGLILDPRCSLHSFRSAFSMQSELIAFEAFFCFKVDRRFDDVIILVVRTKVAS